jgi:hypothetical protein
MVSSTSCAVFGSSDLNLDPNQIHRFVLGEADAPSAMTPQQAAAELADPFATRVLLRGRFPGTAEEAVNAIKGASPDGDPLRDQMSFVLGEGSQIPFDGATAGMNRGLRFVATLGATANGPPEGPDVLVSVSHPLQTGVELMAWDRQKQGFNFYRSMGDPPAWVFAGNARHALTDPTQGKGPFESHTSGALLMKELKFPWVHWDSTVAHIAASVFPPGDDRPLHPWFVNKEPGGAYTFEFEVARPAIGRWATARFEAIAQNGGTIDAARIMRQIVETPTANLASSKRESRTVGQLTPIDLPPTFFVDADGLAEVGLQAPPAFEVTRERYQASLDAFGVRLEDEQGFSIALDTHFAFVVPERALEDQLALHEAIRIGLVSRRLAACLLMTDFPNPIFSDRRAALMAHVPATAQIESGASTFSQEMADTILAAAAGSADGSPEREFAERWNAGEPFEGPFNALLGNYYAAVQTGLADQGSFDDYFKLAESRRLRGVEELPIFGEFKLLFAQTDVEPASRAMRPDGTVSEA